MRYLLFFREPPSDTAASFGVHNKQGRFEGTCKLFLKQISPLVWSTESLFAEEVVVQAVRHAWPDATLSRVLGEEKLSTCSVRSSTEVPGRTQGVMIKTNFKLIHHVIIVVVTGTIVVALFLRCFITPHAELGVNAAGPRGAHGLITAGAVAHTAAARVAPPVLTTHVAAVDAVSALVVAVSTVDAGHVATLSAVGAAVVKLFAPQIIVVLVEKSAHGGRRRRTLWTRPPTRGYYKS